MSAAALAVALAVGLTAPALPLQPGAPAELRVVVDSSTAMPMTEIAHGELTGGIHRDLGLALARQLGANARFAAMPRKRVAVVLESGQGDLACHYLPSWLPGQFDWSIAFLPNATIVVSSTRYPAPARLAALGGVPLGTVLGFAYPEMQTLLGPLFIRDDATDSLQNLTKFAAGRIRHALSSEVFFHYQQRLHPHLLQVHRPLLVARFEARCAVSRRGRYSLAQVDQAIRALQKSGQIDAIYARYR